MFASLSALAVFVTAALAATVTVKNNCNAAVDPAFFPAASGVGGFSLAPGTSQTVTLPVGYSGKAWGRTDCDANGACGTGTCPGGVDCTGPPAASAPLDPTFAPFAIDAFSNLDQYSVSTTNGFNVPVTVASSSGCQEAPVTCTDASGDGNECNQQSFCPTGTDYTLSFC